MVTKDGRTNLQNNIRCTKARTTRITDPLTGERDSLRQRFALDWEVTVFDWWGRTVVRIRWAVLAAGCGLALVGGLWGPGVFDALADDGFTDPGSESARAASRIVTEVGRQDVDLIVLYSSTTATVEDGAFRDAVTAAVARAGRRSEVATVASWYDTGSPAMVSTDRHATYVAVQLARAGDTDAFHAVRPDLRAAGLRTQFAGATAITADITDRVSADIVQAELVSMPILAVLLLFVFGSAVAASTPLLVGGLVVLVGFVAVRILTMYTEVSVFGINIITLLGMGLAIDYALFMVSRFREELAAGHDPATAVQRTIRTAGRTITVSGLIVTLALASLLVFPQMFLRSMGLGGMIAVLMAMVTALTVLPALLAVLGSRVNAGRIRLPRRGARAVPADAAATGDAPAGKGDREVWARLAQVVMRRPVTVITATLTALVLLGLPFTGARFGGPDERVLPPGEASRVAADRLATDFPGGASSSMRVLVSGGDAARATAFAARIGQLAGVTSARVTAAGPRSSVITVGVTGPSAGDTARDAVTGIRALPAPAGTEILVAGRTADLVDLLESLAARLPWMALIVGASMFVMLFLAFGSLVLPVKAIVMSAVSIAASFGTVVWVFQDGHLSGLLGFTSTGDLEATQLILMLAVLLGLSTDYEVFLMSRIREEWDATGDNVASVACGMQRTGRIITSAALLLVVVVVGFTTGGISLVKMIGVGMIVAVVIDATIVRMLLVPAAMRLLGQANWWLPGPLAGWYRRFGITEGDRSR
jgi:RND superfamily putative drug exporter